MSVGAVEALQAEIGRARALMGSLQPQEWAAASGCTGWSVQDVVCHMASVFHTIADPATIDSGSGPDAELNAEVPVQARRSWSPAQVVAEYDQWSTAGLAALAALQEPPMRDTVVPLANLGSHPLHLLANAIVFDHYCHLRHDIGAAVERSAVLPRHDDVLAATLEWMLAGLPQMCAPALASCQQGINLVFRGPAAGGYVLSPGSPWWTITPGLDDSLPSVTTSAHDFVSWATKRTPWRDGTTVTGDVEAAVPTLDALNII